MKNIKTILDNEVSEGKSPSVQYLFFNADSIIYEYAVGYADLTTKMKVDRNTTFNAFSVTKTFTALAIMQLVEERRISLETSVRHYLTDSKISDEVTVKHLLTHTSGLDNPLPLSWIHLASEHEIFKRDDFFNPILEKNIQLKNVAGSTFKYSNLGYIYLAQIIETVSGMEYGEYVKKNILDRIPLESDVLDFVAPHDILHAKGYHNNRSLSMILFSFMIDKSKYMSTSVGKWKPFRQYYVNGAPYGGLIGNSRGFVKYGQELLKENNSLISESNKKLLFLENVSTKGKNTGMCLSWFKGKVNEYQYFSHAGGGGGYYCELRLYPNLKSGSFIVFNRSGFKDERFLDQLDTYFLSIR